MKKIDIDLSVYNLDVGVKLGSEFCLMLISDGGIKTISDLCKLSDKQLRTKFGLDSEDIYKIEYALAQHWLSLDMEEEELDDYRDSDERYLDSDSELFRLLVELAEGKRHVEESKKMSYTGAVEVLELVEQLEDDPRALACINPKVLVSSLKSLAVNLCKVYQDGGMLDKSYRFVKREEKLMRDMESAIGKRLKKIILDTIDEHVAAKSASKEE